MHDIHLYSLDRKRRYVVGLTWQAEQASSAKQRAEVIKHTTAAMQNFPLGERPTHRCTRVVGDYLELGFARVQKNARPATALTRLMAIRAAQEGVKTWAAMLMLEEGVYWFGAALDGIALPGTDIVGDQEAILSAWREKASLFAPDESAVYVTEDAAANAGVTVIALDQWLLDIPLKEWLASAIKPMETAATPKVVATLMVIVGLGGWIGWNAWQKHQQEAELAALIAQQQANPPVNLTPWRNHPPVVAFIEACLRARNGISMVQPGWVADEAVCEGGDLKLAFNKDEKAVGFGPNELVRAFPNVVLLPGGKRSTLSIPLTIRAGSSLSESALPDQALIRTVHGRLGPYGLKTLDLSPSGGDPAGAPKAYKFSAKGDVLTTQDITLLIQDISTLRITRAVVLDPYKLDIEGVAYAH